MISYLLCLLLAQSQGEVKITGTARHGETGKPVSGIQTFAYAITEDMEINLVDSTTTNPKGRFSFVLNSKLSIITGIYKGLNYRTGVISTDSLPKIIELIVWDTTGNPENIEITRNHIVVIKRDDAFEVVDMLSVLNKGSKTFSPAFHIKLPAGAQNPVYMGGLLPWERHFTKNEYIYTSGIIPGQTVIPLMYRVSGKFTIDRSFPFSVNNFEVLTTPEIKVEGFEENPEKLETPEGVFLAYKIKELSSGQRVKVELSYTASLLSPLMLKKIFPFILIIIFVLILFGIRRWKAVSG